MFLSIAIWALFVCRRVIFDQSYTAQWRSRLIREFIRYTFYRTFIHSTGQSEIESLEIILYLLDLGERELFFQSWRNWFCKSCQKIRRSRQSCSSSRRRRQRTCRRRGWCWFGSGRRWWSGPSFRSWLSYCRWPSIEQHNLHSERLNIILQQLFFW